MQGQRHLNSTNVDYQPDAIQHMGLFRQWAADVADETALFFCHSDYSFPFLQQIFTLNTPCRGVGSAISYIVNSSHLDLVRLSQLNSE